MMKTRKMLAFLSAITMTASACLPAVSVKAAALTSEAAEAYKALVQNTTVAEQTGYSLHDLTGDGQDELIICTSQGHGGGEYAFYTYENGEAVPAFDDGEAQEAYTVWFKDDTQVLVMTAGTAAWTDIVFFEINGKTVTATDSVSKTQDTYYKDGDTSTEISEEEYNSILAKYGISGNLADAGYIHLGHDYELTDLSPLETAEPTETTEPAKTSQELYADVLEKFYQNISNQWEDYKEEEYPLYGTEGLTPENSSYMWRRYEKEKTTSEAGYQFIDLNGDGIDELIVGIIDDPIAYDIYTISDGNVVHLAASGERDRFYIGNKNEICEEGSGGVFASGYEYYLISDGALKTSEIYVFDAYADENQPYFYATDIDAPYYDADGELIVSKFTHITKEEYDTGIAAHTYQTLHLTPFSTLHEEVPTEPTTEKEEVNYDKVYSDFVYNDLLKDPGKADWDAFITKNYDIKRVSGVVSTAIYDFEQDGVKELLVVTRDNIDSAEDEYNTKFTLHLYQADEDGNIRFLDEYTLPDEHPVTAADLPRTYTEAEMMISGNAVYEKARSAVYASDDTGTHYYNIIGVKDGKFTPYNLSTEYASVYDNNSLLYADKSVDTSSPSGTYDSASEASDDITQKLKDQRLNFNSASVSTVRTELNEYVSLNIDVNPDVQLFSYVFPDYVENSTGNFNKQSLQSVMIEKLTSVNVTDSGNSKSSSSSSSSSKSSGSSSSSAGGSPKTGEALPIAAGVTAVGALTAVFFSKKKKN